MAALPIAALWKAGSKASSIRRIAGTCRSVRQLTTDSRAAMKNLGPLVRIRIEMGVREEGAESPQRHGDRQGQCKTGVLVRCSPGSSRRSPRRCENLPRFKAKKSSQGGNGGHGVADRERAVAYVLHKRTSATRSERRRRNEILKKLLLTTAFPRVLRARPLTPLRPSCPPRDNVFLAL
jgi:hypothetical protein